MGKMTKAQRRAAAVKAAKTRKKNKGGGGSRRSSHSRGGFSCPSCGAKLPKSMLKHKKRKVNPAQRRKFINARKLAIKAGWSGVPGAKITKQQKEAFGSAFH